MVSFPVYIIYVPIYYIASFSVYTVHNVSFPVYIVHINKKILYSIISCLLMIVSFPVDSSTTITSTHKLL